MTDLVPIPDQELGEIEQRAHAASPAPWEAFIEARDHTAGDDFIRIGGFDDAQPDMSSSTTSERARFESPPPIWISSLTPVRTYPPLWPR